MPRSRRGPDPALPPNPPLHSATYDLLSNRPREHFQHEPPHAFATLSAADRRRLRDLLGLPALAEEQLELVPF